MIKTGFWLTDTGSKLYLDIRDNFNVTGNFTTAHGQPNFDETFPITGFVNGPLIGFTVSWKKYKSITSWAGVHGEENGRECIRAAWHLVRQYADKAHSQENEYWESFLTYTGTYYYSGEQI